VYLDSKGLIVQSNGDGGDTLQREGFWYEGLFLNPMYPIINSMLSYEPALNELLYSAGYARYWQAPYNDPTDTSRDQLVSNIRIVGYNVHNNGFKYIIKYILFSILKNWSRFPNGDIAFINDYGRFIRAFRCWWLYPVLFLCDIPIVVNSIIRCIAGRNPNNVGDDVNHIGDLAQCQKIYPTPVSFLARKLYKWFRPFGVQYALNWYFRADSGGNPEFALLWAPIVANF
jgi:hypothetical protein